MKKKKTLKPDAVSPDISNQSAKGITKSISGNDPVFNHMAAFESSEEKIKLLAHAISSIKESVVITDANNKILFVNDAFVQTYGFSREELYGQSIGIVRGRNIPSEYAEKIRNSTIQNGWVGELINKRKDGTEFPVTLSTAVVRDNDGNPIALIGISTDITERKKNETKLSDSEKSYRELFNTISDAVYVQSKDGKFLDVNSGAEKMYGYGRNEFIGRTPEFLSAPGKNNLTDIIGLVEHTFETGCSNSFEFWGLRKNGEIFPKIVTINRGYYFGQEVVIAIGHDITQQRERELILKESEERYKSLFHNSNAVMLLIDPENGNIVDANGSACEYYKYSKEEITSLKIYDINTTPADRINGEMAKVSNKTNYHFFFKHKLANNEIRDVEIYSGAVEINGKKLLHSIVHDITEKKEIEETLRIERDLFVGGPVTVFKWKATPEAPAVYVSPNVKTTLGYDAEEFLSNSVNFKQLIHPDDVERIYKKSRDTYDKGSLDCELQYRIKNKDGSYRWYFDFTHIITDEAGTKTAFHSYLFDNSAQKEAEEALRSERELFIGGPVTVFKWKASPEAPTEYVSPNVLTTLGYEPEEFLNGSVNFKQLIHPEDRQRIYDEIKKNIDAGIFNYEQQYRLKNKNGNYRWYFDFTRVISNQEGVITDYHGYLFDNTAQKEAEEAHLRSEEELRKTNTMKDKFFSIISHDLRSPFQGLIGIANILVEDEELTQQERKEFTQKLYEGLKTQFNFIDDLLTWNRIQRGAIEFNPTLNDLSRLIEETISLLRNSVENKNMSLIPDLPENLSFNFDWNMIATAMRNLISNAVKFTHKGGTVRVTVRELPNSVLVSVEDTGIGISVVDLEKLWRVDTNHSSRGTEGEDGTGLGLILCKEFIEKHNGKISAESRIGKGSTFSFTLPKNLDSAGVNINNN